MRAETVARHDVETDAGQELRLRFGVASSEGFEDLDLANNVEVVDAVTKTGVRHWFRRRREWAGEAKHGRNVLDRRVNSLWIAKIERARGKPERFSDCLGLPEIASGQNRPCAFACRHIRNQLTGVAGRMAQQFGPVRLDRLEGSDGVDLSDRARVRPLGCLRGCDRHWAKALAAGHDAARPPHRRADSRLPPSDSSPGTGPAFQSSSAGRRDDHHRDAPRRIGRRAAL